MAQPIFHMGQSADDLAATTAVLRSNNFGDQSTRSLIPGAMQRGELIVMRDQSTKQALGATILDTTTTPGALFVPFILVSKDETNTAQISLHRKLLDLVFTTALSKGVDRVVFIRNQDPQAAKVVKDFNTQVASKNIKVTLRTMGTVKNMFGDGRTVTTASLFIPTSQRPNLVTNLTATVDTLSRTTLQTSTGLGNSGDVCSGCKEGKEGEKDVHKEKDGTKDKEGGKESKDKEKEGIEAQPLAHAGKISLELSGQDAAALFKFYNQIGVQKFDPAAPSGGSFAPLV